MEKTTFVDHEISKSSSSRSALDLSFKVIDVQSDIYRERIQSLLDLAGITINGSRVFDIQVHHPDLFKRILGGGTMALGEAYMDGWWSCQRLDLFFARVLDAELAAAVTTLKDKWFFLKGHLRNRQTHRRARKVAQQHYNIGNDLYRAMLDKRMIYTCAYWQDAENLDQAQKHKLELVCRKLKLEPGMTVLDIGCGWGGAARYMAEYHDVKVVGVSNSEEQIEFARNHSDDLNVEYKLLDYRDISGQYDRIYSLGMFEHVGFKNYQTFFDAAHQSLKDGGLMLLHTIGHRQTMAKVDPWIEHYIFPNSILPSSELISKHSAPLFNLEDWHNFGPDYYRTLMAWWKNISTRWSELDVYDTRFQRMWHYYLMASAGTFKASRNHLWQIVFSKGVQENAYQAVRSGA